MESRIGRRDFRTIIRNWSVNDIFAGFSTPSQPSTENPQKTLPIPSDLESKVSQVAAKGDCAEYIKRLVARVSDKGKAFSDDVGKLFARVGQNGFKLKTMKNDGDTMKVVTPILLFCVTVMAWQSDKDPDWHQVVPLRSTRADVERLLGTSTSGGYSATYKLEEGNLFIVYSSGPCTPERAGGWNVPKDVVVQMSFSPKLKKRVSDLKLDQKKFRKVIDEHVGGVVYYINDDLGLMYEVQRGKVDVIYYEPGTKDKHLHCGDPVHEESK